MVAHSIVRSRVSVTLGKAGPAQTRENGRLPKGIAVLTELVICYCVTNYPQAYCLKTNNLLSRYAVLCLVAQLCLFVTPWTAGLQAPLSMEILQAKLRSVPSAQNEATNWSRLPCSPPGNLPNQGIKPRSPPLQMNSWEHVYWASGITGDHQRLPYIICLVGTLPSIASAWFFKKSWKVKIFTWNLLILKYWPLI